MMLTLYVGNSTVLELVDLIEAITGEVQTTAAVTVTLKGASGTPVAGVAWPVAMTHVQGTPGTYRALLDPGIEVTSGEIYTAEVDVSVAGIVGNWKASVQALTRRR